MKPYYAHHQDGRVVGRAYVAYDPDEDDYAVIDNVKVEREYRRRGIATALVREVLADADREGIEVQLAAEPFADSGVSARALRAWYRTLGFKSMGRTRMRRRSAERSAR